jgi:diguanylate cyclase (GGDEF)-like protein
MDAPIPHDEVRRLEALHRYDRPVDPGDRVFDDLVKLAASVCRTPVAMIKLVDRDRLWLRSAIGVTASQVPRRGSFAAHAVCDPGDLLVVPDARHDPRFSCHPFVTHEPHVRFYAAAPLVVPAGHAIGVLSVADHVARNLRASERSELQALAQQVIRTLDLRQRVRSLEDEISERAQYERCVAAHQRRLQTSNNLLGIFAMTDSLTGLCNRRAFEQRLAVEVSRANRLRYALSLLMIDIDDFKRINDTFGHPAGDQVLRKVAEMLGCTARATDFVARLGGDEFAVILPGTGLAGARHIGERCRAAIEAASWPHTAVRISIGCGRLAPGAFDGSDLIVAADRSLLFAKRAGGNRVAVADTDHEWILVGAAEGNPRGLPRAPRPPQSNGSRLRWNATSNLIVSPGIGGTQPTMWPQVR